MKASSEDRLTEGTRKPRLAAHLTLAVLIIAATAAVWYFTRDQEPPAVDEVPVAAQTTPAPLPEPAPEPPPPAPDIPEPAPPPAAAPAVPQEPVPTLPESDLVLRGELAAATDSPLFANTLAGDNLVERGVALVDVLSRGELVQRLIAVPRPTEKFSVIERDDVLYLDPDSYSRFDEHALAVEQLDTEVLVATFHWLRPLLEQVYANLGYDAAEFDNAVIRSLDRILAAPLQTEPLQVKPKGGIYQFADPALEQLKPVQKLLLRTGPENTARIQSQARDLRLELLRDGASS